MHDVPNSTAGGGGAVGVLCTRHKASSQNFLSVSSPALTMPDASPSAGNAATASLPNEVKEVQFREHHHS